MNCPLDNTPLAITERQGIEIDYCPKCRGVWLDRGELDKLIERNAQYEARHDAPGVDAPSSNQTQQSSCQAPPPIPQQPQGQSGPDIAGIVGDLINKGLDKRRQASQYGNSGHRKKKGGLLGELFDF